MVSMWNYFSIYCPVLPRNHSLNEKVTVSTGWHCLPISLLWPDKSVSSQCVGDPEWSNAAKKGQWKWTWTVSFVFMMIVWQDDGCLNHSELMCKKNNVSFVVWCKSYKQFQMWVWEALTVVVFIACTVCLFFSCSWNMTQTVKNIQGGRKTMMTVMRQMKMKMTRMMTGPRSGAGPGLQWGKNYGDLQTLSCGDSSRATKSLLTLSQG